MRILFVTTNNGSWATYKGEYYRAQLQLCHVCSN
jgi:hypothetical protein